MTISEILLPEFDQEMANTRKLLACVPDDKLTWKPHQKSMPMGKLASHVAELPQWAVETMNRDSLELTPDMKPVEYGSRAELLAALDKNAEAARTAIQGVSDETMSRQWSLIFGGHTVLSMPKASVLRSVVMNHLVHHRAQLGVYLRLNDIAIPGMYGPSADEASIFSAASA